MPTAPVFVRVGGLPPASGDVTAATKVVISTTGTTGQKKTETMTVGQLAGAAATTGQSNDVITLTGGGPTSLDGTPGVLDGSTQFTLGRFVALNVTGKGLKWVELAAGTQATDGVSFVRPSNYNDILFPYVFNIIG